MALLLDMVTVADGPILDVGCANGHLLRSMSTRRRFGIEPNAAMARAAEDAGVRVVARDIFDREALASWQGRCDVVSAIAVLEHLTDIRAGLDAMVPLLSHDGVLVFEVPLMAADEADAVWLRTSLEHIWYPTLGSVSRLVSGHAGFELVSLPSRIQGFGWTLVGLAGRDAARMARLRSLVDRALCGPIAQIGDARERRLRFLYDVVYRAAPSEEHQALINDLDESGLVRRLATLLASRAQQVTFLETQCQSLQEALDATTAAYRRTEEARDWHHDQAERWRNEVERPEST
jgi:SAM-dependent methyltransferase